MATITKGYTFGATEQVTNAKLHTLVDSAALSSLVNADIDAAAAIALTKLATVPMIYADTRTKIAAFTRALDAASGDVAYTSVGFQPTGIIFLACRNSTSLAIGFDNATYHGYVAFNNTPASEHSETKSVYFWESAGKTQDALVKSFDADGFTLTWARTGATGGETGYGYYLAFR